MRITLLTTGLQVGGAERQVCSLAECYSMAGHDVQVVSLTGDAIIFPSDGSIEVVELKAEKKILSMISAYLRARATISKFRPDVVHSHMVHANIFSRLLRLTARFPKLICTAHSSNEGGRIRMLAYRLTDSLCDIMTNVGEASKQISINRGAVPAHKIIAMYNGINTDAFTYDMSSRVALRKDLGVEDNVKVLLAVGRLTEAKDYPNLFAAFSIVHAQDPSTRLVVIGCGEEESYLRSLAQHLDIKEHICFLGLRHDVSAWMSAADLYVMSSAWEGIPLVLLEAMSCELAVVATDCGGIKEMLNGFGHLVPPQNPNALANAIVSALSLDSSERNSITTMARKYVESKFSLQSIANKWLSIYK